MSLPDSRLGWTPNGCRDVLFRTVRRVVVVNGHNLSIGAFDHAAIPHVPGPRIVAQINGLAPRRAVVRADARADAIRDATISVSGDEPAIAQPHQRGRVAVVLAAIGVANLTQKGPGRPVISGLISVNPVLPNRW